MVAVTKVVVPAQSVVRMDLSGDEAEVLRTVLRHVSGHPEESPRGVVDSIGRALQKAGVSYWSEVTTGSIHFTGTPDRLMKWL